MNTICMANRINFLFIKNFYIHIHKKPAQFNRCKRRKTLNRTDFKPTCEDPTQLYRSAHKYDTEILENKYYKKKLWKKEK